jgi:3-oxoacyl-[acyl-carrier-protein] synthase-3
MTNDDLAKLVDTSDAWIRERTGIAERRIASVNDTTASMAINAAVAALDVAGVSGYEIDLVIVATATPEHLFPSTASLVQDALGADHAGAFDLSAACSGFVYALSMAADAIRAGSANTVIVIGAETLSRVVNWKDRNTCVLFGDGAGAVVLQASDQPGGVLSTLLRSDGSGSELLIMQAGGSKMPITPEVLLQDLQCIQMNGREVFRFATRAMDRGLREVMHKAGWVVNQVDMIVPHQANIRIIEAAAKSLGLSMEKFFVNLNRYGNTSAASIPIALTEAAEAGKLRPADRVAMVGFGAGLTWAAAAVQWSQPRPQRRSKKAVSRIELGVAGVRSRAKRIIRRVEDRVFGTPSPRPASVPRTPVPNRPSTNGNGKHAPEADSAKVVERK